ncbi:MAG: alcohol dehydrogenase [Deltaproteobacteria bacterium HGW-Deltaproteobacteria-14]|jgi:NADPH:quinone reductase-like Zn-dependent oxidoreductase|nr:MAG: alcohol dehydrogenase [Deltaproteobacteria bacterium HGW-Deltaproteobacteria-14]
MKAAIVREHGGPEVLRIEDVPDPEPGPGEVAVAVRACAINHLDLWVRRGIAGAGFHLPRIGGADIAGEVHALGEGVDDIALGTAVMVAPGVSCGRCERCVAGLDHLCARYAILGEGVDGGLAERVVVPRANLVPKPARLDWTDAAALSLPWLTAWHMLTARAALRGGETILVHAAGSGVSSAGIQIARFLGARVIATAGSDAKLERARQIGADETINYRTEDFVARVRTLTEKRGADVVLEHVGGETFERSLRCLARAGRVVTCGATTGARAAIDLQHIFFKSQSILGSTMGSKAEFHQLVRLYDRGIFTPIVDRVLPLAGIRDAHEALEGREVFGKVVLTP